MDESRDSSPPHKFDVKFLKNLYEELSRSYDKQASSLASLDKTIAEMQVMLRVFESKEHDQDARLAEHSRRIHVVEMLHASCSSESQIKGLWHHIKRLNAFMDIRKAKDGIDTGVIDKHAQRIQHAIDLAEEQDPISYKVAVLKTLPWIIITIIIAIVLTTMVTLQAITGNPVFPTLPKTHSGE